MFDDAQCRFLLPGEMHLTDSPMMINTVLGSCISVTMYSKKHTLSMICHSMLPNSSETFRTDENIFKYTDGSIICMHDILQRYKIPQNSVEVKLFGGSDMFSSAPGTVTVGQKNIDTATTLLNKLNYSIKAKDIGGQFTRKLYFSTDSGIVYIRKISKLKGV